jgi:hypothetical protein
MHIICSSFQVIMHNNEQNENNLKKILDYLDKSTVVILKFLDINLLDTLLIYAIT